MSIDLKAITFKVTKEMDEQLQAEAQRRETTVSHILRLGVEAYFQGEEAKQQNMKTLVYEIVKTRAVNIRGLNLPEDKEALLLEQAGKDATAYVEGLKK